MKKLVMLILLLTTQTTQASLEKLGRFEALAEGSIELTTTAETQKTLDSGPVIVEISRLNILTSPIEFAKGARQITVTKEGVDFNFTIPSQLLKQEGRVTIHRDQAQQSAHVSYIEDYKLIEFHEEESSKTCKYTGICYTCTLGTDGSSDCNYKHSSSCSGTQRALYRNDKYLRNLKILIYTDTKASRIHTNNIQESKRTFIKNLSSCS